MILLERLTSEMPPPYQLPEAEFFVVLSTVNGPIEIASIAPEAGRRLLLLQAGTWQPSDPGEVGELVEAGLVLA